MDTVWHKGVVEENNLNQAIFTIRKSLGNQSTFVQTVPRQGYCFTAVVEAENLVNEILTEQPTPNLIRRHLALTAVAFAVLLVSSISLSFAYLKNASPSIQLAAEHPLPNAEIKIMPNSIAVMPFSTLNPNDENNLFTLGLHIEIINQLAKLEHIKVIGREGVMALSSETTKVSDIRRLLHVESVMYGAVMYSDNMARINLQIVDTNSQLTLWSGTFDTAINNLDEIFSIQSDIAANVSSTLRTTLDDRELKDIHLLPTSSVAAYRYFLAARNAYDNQNLAQAWNLSRLALEQDPQYLEAIYTFSHTNTVLMGTPLADMSSEKHFELALQSAEQYIKLAPENPQGYALKAGALSGAGKWKDALTEIARMSHMGFSLGDMKFYALLLSLGEFDKAIAALEENLQTEPINIYGRGFLMAAYEMAGKREQAIETYKIGEELNPVWWGDGVQVLISLGRHEALNQNDIDDMLVDPELKQILHRINDREYVMKELKRQLASGKIIPAGLIYYSAIAAYHGEHEQAVAMMQNAVPEVWTNLLWMWLPVFDEARKLESFHTLLSNAGLPEYWHQYGWPKVCTPLENSFNCNWQAYPSP